MLLNQFTFISNLFIIILLFPFFVSLKCDSVVFFDSTIGFDHYLNPVFFDFCLVFNENLIFYSFTFLLGLFFIFKNEKAKVVEPKSIAGSIIDGIKDIARWIGDKIKGFSGGKAREVVWVIIKTILKEMSRPILIIAALACWVFCYSLAVYFYVVYYFSDFAFWILEFQPLMALFGLAFGKAFKSFLLLKLIRCSALFLLVLVVLLKKFG